MHHPLFNAALLLVLSWSSFFCLSCTSLSTHAFIVMTAHFRHALLSSAHPRFICPEQQQPSWFLSLFIVTHINMTMWDSNYVITDVAVLTLQQCSFLPLPSFYNVSVQSHQPSASASSSAALPTAANWGQCRYLFSFKTFFFSLVKLFLCNTWLELSLVSATEVPSVLIPGWFSSTWKFDLLPYERPSDRCEAQPSKLIH